MKASFLYDSLFTGERCVCIITGADGSCTNRKTGAMAQMWFLLMSKPPHQAVKEGCDRGVCGTCPLRGGRGCYVRTEQAPLSIWRKWLDGGYQEELPPELPALRLGAYGDPASVPRWRWEQLMRELPDIAGWTGYTHGWRDAPWLRATCMASVERRYDALEAWNDGWSVFETVPEGDKGLKFKEVQLCRAVAKGVQCEHCLLCSGSCTAKRWIQIPAHGARRKLVHASRNV